MRRALRWIRCRKSNSSDSTSRVDDPGGGNLAHSARTTADHGQPQLHIEDIENTLDTVLAEGRQPPGVGAANANRAGAEGERLEGASATAPAAIDHHGNLTGNGRHYIGQ